MAKRKKKDWIDEADLDKGALTRKAQAAHKTIAQFCAQPNLSPKSQKQCNLAKTFKKMRDK